MAAANRDEETKKEKSLQDILNLSIKYSEQEMAELKPTKDMDPSRKEFLQNAIKYAVENDDANNIVKETARLLTYKHDGVFSEDELTEIADVFEHVNYLLEGRDIANDFDKLGGIKYCLKLLQSNYTSLQWRAADTIANCVQNNSKTQYSVLEEKGFEIMLYTLKKTDVDIVCVKCLYALSSMLGGNTAAEKLFIGLKGVNVVIKFVTNENPKVRLKSAFLLRKVMLSETARFVENKKEIAMQLLEIIGMEHDDSHETIADVLLILMKIDEPTLDKLKKSRVDINSLFNKRKEELLNADAEKHEDLIEIHEKILELL